MHHKNRPFFKMRQAVHASWFLPKMYSWHCTRARTQRNWLGHSDHLDQGVKYDWKTKTTYSEKYRWISAQSASLQNTSIRILHALKLNNFQSKCASTTTLLERISGASHFDVVNLTRPMMSVESPGGVAMIPSRNPFSFGDGSSLKINPFGLTQASNWSGRQPVDGAFANPPTR